MACGGLPCHRIMKIMRRLGRIILAVLFVVLCIPQVAHCQKFTSFFLDFVRHPEHQSRSVSFPLRAESGVVRSAKSYLPLRLATPANVPILCSDSLELVSQQKEVNVSVVDMMKMKSVQYVFEKKSGSWRMISSAKDADFGGDRDFVDFLVQYSQDVDFQKKRTIFPFPYRTYKENRSNELDSKLMMPREWEPFDFVALFPSLCLFTSERSVAANNRRLFVMKNGDPYLYFNFISINKKWYLIEMEEFR